MYLKHIKLTNYRNYEQTQLELDPSINIFFGQNGQGKTNLLEAIYYLACGRNFRGNRDRELIRWEAAFFRLEGIMQRAGSERNQVIDIYYDLKPTKQVKINGVTHKNVSRALFGQLQVVLFAPDDLRIIKGSPGERRRYIDMILVQIDKNYARTYSQYNKVLAQRNNILKKLAYAKHRHGELLPWNDQLVTYGTTLIKKRLDFLRLLVPAARRIQKKLTDERETFNITYQSSLGGIGQLAEAELAAHFHELLLDNQEAEITRGTTLFGPHRDDLIFYLNNRPLKTYGSQGQQRTGILAVKMAEVDIFYDVFQQYPLLLLDDVMSELDDRRRSYLLEVISAKKIQAIITGANIDLLGENCQAGEFFTIQEGKIIT